jgi:L-histidine Nalpha-methyltransferase
MPSLEPSPPASSQAHSAFAVDVARDLQRSPKQLQARYLYDALGSRLFEAICRLPWYQIAVVEELLLHRRGPAIFSQLLPTGHGDVCVIELGVGSGEKMATLLRRLPPAACADVHLVDISPTALTEASARLARFPNVSVTSHVGTYEDGLRALPVEAASGPRLVLLLGSNIGNFDREAAALLLRAIRSTLRPGDWLLLGADLVKPVDALLVAYDDPLGVTAAFNKNLLLRINRELHGTFDLATFDHRAVWNAPEQRVEMHLVSRMAQTVSIDAIGIEVVFQENETIWTESSYKYTEPQLARLGLDLGFGPGDPWTDESSTFALVLFQAV